MTKAKKKKSHSYDLWTKIMCGTLYRDRESTGDTARSIAEKHEINDPTSVSQWGKKDALERHHELYYAKYREDWNPHYNPEKVNLSGNSLAVPNSVSQELQTATMLALEEENKKLKEVNRSQRIIIRALTAQIKDE